VLLQKMLETFGDEQSPVSIGAANRPRQLRGPRQLKGWRTVRDLTEELRFVTVQGVDRFDSNDATA
jgi:hypothetical protein